MRRAGPGSERRLTLADKVYNTSDFVGDLRQKCVTLVPIDHRQCRLPLGLAGHCRRVRPHDEAVPVLDQYVARLRLALSKDASLEPIVSTTT